MKFSEYMINKFNNGDSHSVLLWGEGGLGKTYSLLDLYKKLNEEDFYFVNKKLIPLYVPLNVFCVSGISNENGCFIRKYIWSQYTGQIIDANTANNIDNKILNAQGSDYHFVLLCDGLNECANADMLFSEINTLATYINVTVCLTGRTKLIDFKHFDNIELCSLSIEQVKSIIADYCDDLSINENLVSLLQFPFYLNLWLGLPDSQKNEQYTKGKLLKEYINNLLKNQKKNNSATEKIKLDDDFKVDYSTAIDYVEKFLWALSWVAEHNDAMVVSVGDNVWKSAKELYTEEMYRSAQITRLQEELFNDFLIPLGLFKKSQNDFYTYTHQIYREFFAAQYLRCKEFDDFEYKISQNNISEAVIELFGGLFDDANEDLYSFTHKMNVRISENEELKKNAIVNRNIVRLFGEASYTIENEDFSNRNLSFSDFLSIPNILNCNFDKSFFGDANIFSNIGFRWYRPYYDLLNNASVSYLELENIFVISSDRADYLLDASTGETKRFIYDQDFDVTYKTTNCIHIGNKLLIIHGTERGNIVIVDCDTNKQTIFRLCDVTNPIIRVDVVSQGFLILSNDSTLFFAKCNICETLNFDDIIIKCCSVCANVVNVLCKDDFIYCVLLDQIFAFEFNGNFEKPYEIIKLPQKLDDNMEKHLSYHQSIIKKIKNHIETVGKEEAAEEYLILNLLRHISPSLDVKEISDAADDYLYGVDRVLYCDENIIITTSDIFYKGTKVNINNELDASMICFLLEVSFEKNNQLLIATSAKSPEWKYKLFLMDRKTGIISEQPQTIDYSVGTELRGMEQESENTIMLIFEKSAYFITVSKEKIERFYHMDIPTNGKKFVSCNKDGYLLVGNSSSYEGFSFVSSKNFTERWCKERPVGSLFEKEKATIKNNVIFIPIMIFGGSTLNRLLEINLIDNDIKLLQYEFPSGGNILDTSAKNIYRNGTIFCYNYTNNKISTVSNLEKSKWFEFSTAHPVEFYGTFGIGVYASNILLNKIKRYGYIDITNIEEYSVIDVDFPESFQTVILGKNSSIAMGINSSNDLTFMNLSKECKVINVLHNFPEAQNIKSELFDNDDGFFWNADSNMYFLDKENRLYQEVLLNNETFSWSQYHQLPLLIRQAQDMTIGFLVDKCLQEKVKIFEIPYVGCGEINILAEDIIIVIDRECVTKFDFKGNTLKVWHPYMLNVTGSTFNNIVGLSENDKEILLQYGAKPFDEN